MLVHTDSLTLQAAEPRPTHFTTKQAGEQLLAARNTAKLRQLVVSMKGTINKVHYTPLSTTNINYFADSLFPSLGEVWGGED